MGLTIGVDVGGTKVAAGVVDEDGQILSGARRATPSPSPSDVQDALAARVAGLRQGHAGVAPGPVRGPPGGPPPEKGEADSGEPRQRGGGEACEPRRRAESPKGKEVIVEPTVERAVEAEGELDREDGQGQIAQHGPPRAHRQRAEREPDAGEGRGRGARVGPACRSR